MRVTECLAILGAIRAMMALGVALAGTSILDMALISFCQCTLEVERRSHMEMRPWVFWNCFWSGLFSKGFIESGISWQAFGFVG